MINLERLSPNKLTNDGRLNGLGEFVWSPDSRQIAYAADQPGLSELYTVPIDKTREPEPFFKTSLPFQSPLSLVAALPRIPSERSARREHGSLAEASQ